MTESEKVAEALRIVSAKMQRAYETGYASQHVSLSDMIEMMLELARVIDPVS